MFNNHQRSNTPWVDAKRADGFPCWSKHMENDWGVLNGQVDQNFSPMKDLEHTYREVSGNGCFTRKPLQSRFSLTHVDEDKTIFSAAHTGSKDFYFQRRFSDTGVNHLSPGLTAYDWRPSRAGGSKLPLTPFSGVQPNPPLTRWEGVESFTSQCRRGENRGWLEGSVSPSSDRNSYTGWRRLPRHSILNELKKKSPKDRRSSIQLPCVENRKQSSVEKDANLEMLSMSSCEDSSPHQSYVNDKEYFCTRKRGHHFSVYSSMDFSSLSTSPCTQPWRGHNFSGAFSDQPFDYVGESQLVHDKVCRRASIMPDWCWSSPYTTPCVEKPSVKKNLETVEQKKNTPQSSNPVIYAVIDSEFEKLCRDVLPGSQQHHKWPNDSTLGTGETTNALGHAKGKSKKRNRVIFCRVCNQFKPRSTRARFQSCKHIACYDCVRIALHVEFWAAKLNISDPSPKAVCPVCRVPLDWSSIKPYIVLAEEAKYSPVLTLVFSGKDVPSNTLSRYTKVDATQPPSTSPMDERQVDGQSPTEQTKNQEACDRLRKAYNVLRAFFPGGVAMELILSDTCDVSQTFSGQCVNLLLGLSTGSHQQGFSFNTQGYVDPLEHWRKELTS